MLIGLDFDNTLISYGHLFRELAVEQGLVPTDFPEDKGAVRAHIWDIYDDIQWQKLQAAVYGPCIDRGHFMTGAADFMRLCRDRGVELRIVSHKTQYAAIDPGGCDLRKAALGWMEGQLFFESVENNGFGFSRDHVFFASRREEKIARINELGCAFFVDDLTEVLTHPDLDASVERILYQDQPGAHDCCTLAGPWSVITEHVFGDGA